MIRVLLVADDHVQGRLQDILAGDDDVRVVESLSPDSVVPPDLEVDVILWAPMEGPGAPTTSGLAASGVPVLVLGPRVMTEAPTGADVLGHLASDAEPSRILAALHAVAAGLRLTDPAAEPNAAAGNDRPEGTSEAADQPEELTEREHEVLQLLAEGFPNKEIARRLGVSEHTAKAHVTAILGKLGAHTRTEAVARAARAGLITF